VNVCMCVRACVGTCDVCTCARVFRWLYFCARVFVFVCMLLCSCLHESCVCLFGWAVACLFVDAFVSVLFDICLFLWFASRVCLSIYVLFV
jgi:hypothetical protein